MGRAEEAEAELSEVVAGLTAACGDDNPVTLRYRAWHGVLLHDLGQLDLAKAELSAAVEALTRVLGADHPSTLRHRGHVADLLHDLGGTGEADHNA
jgi:tetratricopeptide repeat protein